MEEKEYDDNEGALCKVKCNLKAPHKIPEDVECVVTKNQVEIRARDPIRIPISRIEDCSIPRSSYPLSYGSPSQSTFSDAEVLIFKDAQSNRCEVFLEGVAGSLYSLKNTIEMVKAGVPIEAIKGPYGKLLHNLKSIGLRAGLDSGSSAVKLTGRNIDEVTFCSCEYGAGLLYIVKTQKFKDSKDLYAELSNEESAGFLTVSRGIKWIGGTLAYYLNNDMELMKLLRKTKVMSIQIRANKKLQRIEMLCSMSYPTRESFEIFDRIAVHVRQVANGEGYVGHRVEHASVLRSVISSMMVGAISGSLLGLLPIIFFALTGDQAHLIMTGFLITASPLLFGLATFLSLGIKRLRGRF